jgi:hypothetical protein
MLRGDDALPDSTRVAMAGFALIRAGDPPAMNCPDPCGRTGSEFSIAGAIRRRSFANRSTQDLRLISTRRIPKRPVEARYRRRFRAILPGMPRPRQGRLHYGAAGSHQLPGTNVGKACSGSKAAPSFNPSKPLCKGTSGSLNSNKHGTAFAIMSKRRTFAAISRWLRMQRIGVSGRREYRCRSTCRAPGCNGRWHRSGQP